MAKAFAATNIKHGDGDEVSTFAFGEEVKGLKKAEVEELLESGAAVDSKATLVRQRPHLFSTEEQEEVFGESVTLSVEDLQDADLLEELQRRGLIETEEDEDEDEDKNE